MPPKNEKPIRPKTRGETWELQDGRTVVLLGFKGMTKEAPKIRFYEVLNEKGMLECVTDSQFRKRLEPPEVTNGTN